MNNQKVVIGNYREDELFISLNNLIGQGYVIDCFSRVSKFSGEHADWIVVCHYYDDYPNSPPDYWEEHVSGKE